MTLLAPTLRRPLAALLAVVLALTMLLVTDQAQAVVASPVTFSATPDDPTASEDTSFAWSSTAGNGFNCTLDATVILGCTSEYATGALAEGAHTFEVQATDNGSPIGDPATHAWTIDTTPPVTTLTSTPPDPSASSAWEVLWSISDETSTTARCSLTRLGGAPVFEQFECNNGNFSGGLDDGTYTFSVVATDAAGNEEASPVEYTWTVDTTPPTVTIDSAPNDPTNRTTDGFFFSANEDATFSCALEGPAPAGAADCSEGAESYSNLPEGEHTFTVTPTDTAGNEGTPASHTWTVDTSAPVATITKAPEGAVNTTDASIEFTAEAGATTECKRDALDFATCDSPKVYTGLDEGQHTFLVRATDAAGNVGEADSATWTVDTIDPETTITAMPVDPSNDSTPSFGFQADESEATFECRLDSELEDDFGPCPQDNLLRKTVQLNGPDTTTGSATYGPLEDGEHTFEVRATDAATNTDETPASYTWTIDTEPANTFLIDSPDSLTNTRTETITFDSDDDTAGFECKLDDGHFTECTSPKELTGLADGSHTFTVQSVDPAGNVDPAPASVDWTVDATAPDTLISSGPVEGSTVSDATTTVAFSADGPVDGFECKLDTGDWYDCTSPDTFEAPDGARTYSVRAVDAAGNVDPTPDTVSWTVDTTGPAITIDSGPSGRVATNSGSFAFSSEEELSDVECRIDSGAWSACTSPFPFSGLDDGVHTFEVRGDDSEGNPGSASRSWTIDTTAPQTELTSRPSSSRSTSATIRFRANEATSKFECRVDDGAWTTCTSPQTLTGLSVGTHVFRVRAYDLVGNVDATPALTAWRVEATPDEPAEDGADLFTDVEEGNIFSREIGELARSGVTRGCNSDGTKFCPKDFVTRGQMSAFLTRALKLPAGTKIFDDTRTNLFRADIAALARAEITKGCGGNNFCPDDFVTRGQMAAFLTRALNLPAGTKVFDDTRTNIFRADIAALARAGITTGCGGNNFCPDDFVTREQMAAFMERAGLLD